jgi:hypothetical protein
VCSANDFVRAGRSLSVARTGRTLRCVR